jgi:type IV pilus assembly protein PilO
MALPAFLDPIVTAPKWQRVVFGLMVLALLGAGAYMLLLGPLETQVATLQGRHETLEREVLQYRTMVAQQARAREELAQLQERLVVMKELLPTERELPPLYRRVTDAAFQAGLGVSLFQPKEPMIRDYYTEIPIALTAEGSYHQVGAFFESVARLPRVVTVGDLKLIGLGKGRDTIRTEIVLATYTYRPVGTPPAPKPGAPGATPGAQPDAAPGRARR